MKIRIRKDSPLRRARRKRGLTQAQLSYLTDLSTATIHRIENGVTRSAPNVKTVADFFDLNMDDILDWYDQIDAGGRAA